MSGAVLVLGASGFIGRHLTEALALSGETVLAATRQPAVFEHARINNVVAAFNQPAHFVSLLKRSRCVVHAASTSTPGSSAAQPLAELDGNLRPVLALLQALQEFPDRRLLYLSSGGTVYGDCEGRSALEGDRLRPRSYHGAGKTMVEQFIHAWADQFDGTAIALRPSNVYGPGQLPRSGFGIIPTAFDCALHGQPLTIWGDGSAVRDYLHVADLTNLCRLALTAPDLPDGMHTFNASSDLGVSLSALLDIIDRITGRPLQRIHEAGRRVDIQHIVPDNRAVRTAFAWQPAIGLEDGLQQTWHWFTTRR